MCHNPYFNRWFSAMRDEQKGRTQSKRHNPYFNRWFSAMSDTPIKINSDRLSQSLF